MHFSSLDRLRNIWRLHLHSRAGWGEVRHFFRTWQILQIGRGKLAGQPQRHDDHNSEESPAAVQVHVVVLRHDQAVERKLGGIRAEVICVQVCA